MIIPACLYILGQARQLLGVQDLQASSHWREALRLLRTTELSEGGPVEIAPQVLHSCSALGGLEVLQEDKSKDCPAVYMGK